MTPFQTTALIEDERRLLLSEPLHEKVGMTVQLLVTSVDESETAGERKLGRLEGVASCKIEEGFTMTDEEFLWA